MIKSQHAKDQWRTRLGFNAGHRASKSWQRTENSAMVRGEIGNRKGVRQSITGKNVGRVLLGSIPNDLCSIRHM